MLDKQRKIFLKSDYLSKIHRVLRLFTDKDLLDIYIKLYPDGFIDIERGDMIYEITEKIYELEYKQVKEFYDNVVKKCQGRYGF